MNETRFNGLPGVRRACWATAAGQGPVGLPGAAR